MPDATMPRDHHDARQEASESGLPLALETEAAMMQARRQLREVHSARARCCGSGDPVEMENCYQYAEHFLQVMKERAAQGVVSDKVKKARGRSMRD